MKPTDRSGTSQGNSPESSRDPLSRHTPAVLSGESPSFSAVLDDSFQRLESKRNLDTLRRIDRMEAVLDRMEFDLDSLIESRECGLPGGGGLGET